MSKMNINHLGVCARMHENIVVKVSEKYIYSLRDSGCSCTSLVQYGIICVILRPGCLAF